MLCYGSETDKSSPVRQFPILEVSQSTNDGKTVHIQLSNATLDFQASSKSEAKAIVAKIQESKSLAAPTTTSTAAIPVAPPPPPPVALPEQQQQQQQHVPAPPPAPPAPPVAHHEPVSATTTAEPEPEHEPEPACEPRWAIVLYDFTAEGPEEISTKEEDQVLVVDYVSSDEWWSIEYQDGRSGIVPATYVQFQEDYEADLAREEEQRRKQQEQEAEKQRREAEAAAARQRRLEEEQRQREENARKAEEERQRRQQEEEQRQKEQEARRQAAAAAAAVSASTSKPSSVGAASPRRSQIPAPPPPVNRSPANRASQPIPTPTSPAVNKAKQPQDPGKPDHSKVRIWTDRTGAFKVEAQFLTYHNEKIRLHKVNGVKIDVPVQKMCLEDLRYIEQQTGKKLVEDGTDDVPLAHLANNNRNAPGSKPQWDWFDYFMKANIPMHNSLRYASAFQSEGLGEHDLDNLTHRKMKSLGMSETHVQRLQRFIETGVVEPASDEETPSSKRKMKKSVSFGAISVIDDSDNESVGGYGMVNRQHQIDEDERIARQLQEEYNAQAQQSQQGSPSIRGVGLQRRGTGRPTPSTSAPRDVNTDIMDKIKSQLSSQPLTPTPAQPSSPATATTTSHPPPPPPPPPAAAAANAPLQPTPVARQQTGFADDAWAPRASGSPNVSNSQPDAMTQTKAAWFAPPPPPPPPVSSQNQAHFAPMQNPNLTGIQQQQPLQQSPQQPPVSLPPRQRPTPPAPQNNKVDPQMLSQWTSPNQQSQQQPQPQMQVQQMVAQFNTGNPPAPQQQQQPALPPRSPMNQFIQSPATTAQANMGMMQQQQQPPLPPRSPMNQFNATTQPQFMQNTGSPSQFVQQQPFIQQQQQQPPVMQQAPMSSVPVNSVLPPALVPMNTGMQQPALQPQPTGTGASWAAASKYFTFIQGRMMMI